MKVTVRQGRANMLSKVGDSSKLGIRMTIDRWLIHYQMLMIYIWGSRHSAHYDFPQYGAFICGSQVQLDVSTANYPRVINAFTQIEAAKAYLFANSEFSGADWGHPDFMRSLWEESIFMDYPEKLLVSMQNSSKMRMISLISRPLCDFSYSRTRWGNLLFFSDSI